MLISASCTFILNHNFRTLQCKFCAYPNLNVDAKTTCSSVLFHISTGTWAKVQLSATWYNKNMIITCHFLTMEHILSRVRSMPWKLVRQFLPWTSSVMSLNLRKATSSFCRSARLTSNTRPFRPSEAIPAWHERCAKVRKGWKVSRCLSGR